MILVLRGDAVSVILNTSQAARAVCNEPPVRVAFGERELRTPQIGQVQNARGVQKTRINIS